tara:strand:- start:941 stop:1108 length:168 start_codon:yes stop_codon:yes gene_type:complete
MPTTPQRILGLDLGANSLGRNRLRGPFRAALTEQLLAFGRKQPHSPTVLDLNAVV